MTQDVVIRSEAINTMPKMATDTMDVGKETSEWS